MRVCSQAADDRNSNGPSTSRRTQDEADSAVAEGITSAFNPVLTWGFAPIVALFSLLSACTNNSPTKEGTSPGPSSPPTTAAAAPTTQTADDKFHLGVETAGTWVLLPFQEAIQFEPILHDLSVEEGILLLDGVPVGVDTAWLTVEDALRKVKLVGARMTTLAMPQSLICSPPVRDAVAALNLPRLLVVLRRPGEQGDALTECFRKLGVGDLHVVLNRPTAGQINAVGSVASVTELRLRTPQAGAEALSALAAMPRLQTLELSGVLLTPKAWNSLLALTSLRVLDLGNCRLGESKTLAQPRPDAFKLPASLPKLNALLASEVKGELAPLALLLAAMQAESLIALELPGTPVSDDHGESLQRFANLRSLKVGHASTEALKTDFSALPQLASLDLYGCKVLPDRIPGIAGLKNLKTLCLTGKRLGDDEARQLLAIRGLESLHLGETGITDALLPEVAEMPALKALYLPRTGITDTGIKALSGNRMLRRLALTETKITDNAGIFLGRMKSLVSLVLERTSFGNIGAAFLDELPHLRFLHLDKTQVSDNALSAFARLPALELLDLQGTKVTGTNLAALGEAKVLRQLDLSETPLDPEALAAAGAKLNSVATLNLTNSPVTEATLKWAVALPQLRTLELGGPALQVQSLEYLARSATLNTLVLAQCEVTPEVLEALSRIPALRSLSLPYNPELPAEAFAPLSQLKDLYSLTLKGPATRPADMVQAIREYLPGVQVY